MAGVVVVEARDAHEVSTQVAPHLLDVARSDLWRMEIRTGRKDVALGCLSNHVQHRVCAICRGSVDEEVPVGIVAAPLRSSPGSLEPAGSRRHLASRLTKRLV